MMKKNIAITLLLITAALVLPATAAPTIKMLNDSTPAYTAKILQDGFAGFSAGTIVSTFCMEAHEYFHAGPVLLCRAEYQSRKRRTGLVSMAFMAMAPDITCMQTRLMHEPLICLLSFQQATAVSVIRICCSGHSLY